MQQSKIDATVPNIKYKRKPVNRFKEKSLKSCLAYVLERLLVIAKPIPNSNNPPIANIEFRTTQIP